MCFEVRTQSYYVYVMCDDMMKNNLSGTFWGTLIRKYMILCEVRRLEAQMQRIYPIIDEDKQFENAKFKDPMTEYSRKGV